MTALDEHAYVAQVLTLYRTIPSSSVRVRPADRALARSLFLRGVAIDLVAAAILLATARRIHRPTSATPLPPVRSLHYYLPVIEELLLAPLSPGYLHYLRAKVAATPPLGRT